MSTSLEAPIADQRVRAALLDFFDIRKFNNPVAVTLTMKQRVDGQNLDAISASENLRHFCNRLNAKLLGSAAKRHGKKLQILAVLETSADGRLHYHLVIDRPSHCNGAEFEIVIREQWRRTKFGYDQVDIQNGANIGWIIYILKFRQKTSLARSIDWVNTHVGSGSADGGSESRKAKGAI